MSEKWLVIGVSGVTCGGKTTIANKLNNIFPNAKVVNQDDYFLSMNDPRHTLIKELNHINFDILSSLDMDKMTYDVHAIIRGGTSVCETLASKNSRIFPDLTTADDLQKLAATIITGTNIKILIIEGFCIFNFTPIEKLCNLKYFITLNYDECYARRQNRIYEPPDCPGYFDMCAWPEYLKHYKEIKVKVHGITYFNECSNEPVKKILCDVICLLTN